MIITKSEHILTTKDGSKLAVYVIAPSIPNYPLAKFPGVVVFSEIYQVTGPVERFAGQIASHGYVVGMASLMIGNGIYVKSYVACPSSFHEFQGPEPIPYDTEGVS